MKQQGNFTNQCSGTGETGREAQGQWERALI